MKARDLLFEAADAPGPLRAFVRQHHYSRTCPPSQHLFSARATNGDLMGVCVFRKPSLPNVAKGYGVDLELVRLVMLDAAEKNSESRFIGFSLRWLSKHTKFSQVISFADPRFGHEGIVYRAANFKYRGMEKGHGTRRIVVDGVEWHSKSAYDKWGCSGKALIGMLAPAKVDIIVCPPKHVYTYTLRR